MNYSAEEEVSGAGARRGKVEGKVREEAKTWHLGRLGPRGETMQRTGYHASHAHKQ